MFSPGSIVRSRDPRDDSEIFYVVVEGGIEHRTGRCSKVAEVGNEKIEVYRLDRFLSSADAEVALLVQEASGEARP